jgi:hypothetical protein
VGQNFERYFRCLPALFLGKIQLAEVAENDIYPKRPYYLFAIDLARVPTQNKLGNGE